MSSGDSNTNSCTSTMSHKLYITSHKLTKLQKSRIQYHGFALRRFSGVREVDIDGGHLLNCR